MRNDGSEEYHLYLTNLHREGYGAHDLAQLYRVRWEIELLFKELKSWFSLDEINTTDAYIIEALIIMAGFLRRMHSGIQIETGERLPNLRSDLWMPHNVDIFNGSLHVIDSLPGELRCNNLTVQGEFPAFSRGLDYHNGL